MQLSTTLPFSRAVRARRSVRAFLPAPLPDATIVAILEEAQLAPSNCNTQPWHVHIAAGAKRDQLSAALLQAAEQQLYSKDFSFSTEDYQGRCRERQMAQAKLYYEALGVQRQDAAGRMRGNLANYYFFNAPHVALLFMPQVGDGVRAAADVGMYAQTFLLALAARGLGGVPQTSVGMMADTVREVLGVPTDLKLLFSIAFGYADPEAAASQLVMPRDAVAASVTFHR